MTTTPEQRTANLVRAARAKHDDAEARAETGLRRLIKAGETVNFRSVARVGGVSLDFLYHHDNLRSRIENLRNQQQDSPKSLSPGSNANSSVVLTLTSQLRESRAEAAELRSQLAAAHGQLLLLRREKPGAATPQPQPVQCVVTDVSLQTRM